MQRSKRPLFRKLLRWCRKHNVEPETYFISEQGANSWACRVPALSPGRDDFVLLVHGTGNGALYPFVHIIQELSRQGWETVTFDLAGHGCDSDTVLSKTAIENSLATALTAACERTGKNRAHVVGHSLGGALTLLGLAEPPTKPAVISGTVMSVPLDLNLDLRRVVWEATAPFESEVWSRWPDYGFLGLWPALGPIRRQSYPLRLAGAPRGSFDYLHEVRELWQDFDLRTAARKIHQPLLLIYGQKDGIAPIHHGATICSEAPQGRLSVIPRANHFSLPFRRETVRLITQWLKDQS